MSICGVYAVAAVAREALSGGELWLVSLLAFHLAAALALLFLTNSKSLAAGVAIAAIGLECALAMGIHHRTAAIWLGALIQASFAGYFARRFYLTMGD